MGPLLPKIFRWIFTVLAALAGLAAIAILVAMIVSPTLPAGTHFGPHTFDFGGQPATVVLRAVDGDSDFTFTAFRDTLSIFVKSAGGLIAVLKAYGLPALFLKAIALTALFELMRRLFRNVGRGESFSQQSVRLVQIIGGVLIGYSFVSALTEALFFHAVYGYLTQHAVLTISGTQLRLPAMPNGGFPHFQGFDSPWLFSGLLVLALSEVFRQGLVLKTENDLTV